MKKGTQLKSLFCAITLLFSLQAKLQIITTVAGNGVGGYSGDGGLAINATIGFATPIKFDEKNNIYIAEPQSSVIRRIDASTGIISRIAGTGIEGDNGDGGLAINAQINYPLGLAIDSLGNVYFSEPRTFRVRKIDKQTGIIHTIAGTGVQGTSEDGVPAITAKLLQPNGVALNKSQTCLYVADGFDHKVRKIDFSTGIITTIAGTGNLGYNGDEIPATSAWFGLIMNLAVDKNDDLYICDNSNNRIRKVTTADGIIHTVAGNGEVGYTGDGKPAVDASLSPSVEIALDSSNNIFITDYFYNRIRKVSQETGIITTYAGNGNLQYSGDGVYASEAGIGQAYGVAVDSTGTVFFTISNYPRMCKITEDSTEVNQIHGYAYYDVNKNNQKDESEHLFPDGKIIIKNGSDSTIILASSGNFRVGVDTGKFSIYFLPTNDYYISRPALYNFSFSEFAKEDSVFFALQPVAGKRDLSANMFSLNSAAVPGFESNYKINYENRGTEIVSSGYIELVKDYRFDFLSSTPANDYINGDTIRWNYSNLKPLDTASILVNFDLPPDKASIGDTLYSDVSINPGVGDLTPQDDSASIVQEVKGSFDPNDKSENHGGSVTESRILNGEWLVYSIRFQNTGNALAVNVKLKDTLDKKLDWNSLQMISSSHNCQLLVSNGNNCAWTFSNIMLPDSTTDEPDSHGYIVYRIKAKSNLKEGDLIKNTASIYFDYNAPVQTNTEKTKVVGDVVLPLQLVSFTAKNNGSTNLLQWSTAQEINTDRFEVQRSSHSRDFVGLGTVKTRNNGKTKNDYSFTDALPLRGMNYYRLKIADKDGKFVYSAVKLVNVLTTAVAVYPNPVKNILHIKGIDIASKTMVSIIDMKGNVVLKGLLNGNTLNVQQLAAGVYEVNIETAGKMQSIKFVKE